MNINYKKIIYIFVIVVLMDIVWLTIFGKNMYLPMINDIQQSESKIKYFPAAMTYIFITLLIYLFCIPLIEKKAYNPFICGFLLGFLTYGVFDMTNLALFNKYTYINSILDMTWGGILFGLCCHILNKLQIN